MEGNKAVFLDRDGVINHDPGDYTRSLDEFHVLPTVFEALKTLQDAGYMLILITNQGGIGRGMFTEAEMHQFNNHLINNARAAGGDIKDIAFCPHHPLAPDPAMAIPCRCRKPEPGLIIQLAEKWQINLANSVMIGDRDSDVEAGQRAGMHSYLFDKTDLDHLAKQVLASHFPTLRQAAQ